MFGYPESPVVWWQTRGMARLAGVSLSGAVFDGWLTRTELGEIVTRCEGCQARRRCEAWLAEPRPEGGVAGFCPNRPVIEALAAD
ncbi:MAG: hypothetical protein IAE87_16025 [Rhodobacteraceae bacterium]|jgi:hypothetical protein|nr:hypothetical protein [Paracoccaceae bacterium]